MKKFFYYACVPSEDREQQIVRFRSLGAADVEIYIDIQHGKQSDRTNWNVLKHAGLQDGDALVIPTLDSLSENEQGIRNELQWLHDNGVQLRIVDIPATMQEIPATYNRLVAEILMQMYDVTVLQKKEYKQQRQTEGIHAARAKGVRFGRPPMERDPKFEELKKQWESGQISLREGGRQLGVTHKTFQKWVTEGKKADNGG